MNVQVSELKENTVQVQNNDVLKVKFNNSEKKKIVNDRENIISEIKEKTKTNESVNTIITKTLKENTQETLNKGIQEKIKTKNNDRYKSIELETNIEPETFEINKNLSVTFDDNFVIRF